ncbi:hypothetical protein BJ742DRAFT_553229 [Cladochytrium replicatum]|nr:hypothetical protein BJ742DRAFT_553229 [Cladochytrium replicatum]
MGATCKTKKLVDSLGNPAVFATTTTTVVRPTTTAAAVNGTRAAGPTGTGVPVVGALIHNNVVGAAVVGRPQPAEVKSSTSSWFGSLVPGRFRPGSRSATDPDRFQLDIIKKRWDCPCPIILESFWIQAGLTLKGVPSTMGAQSGARSAPMPSHSKVFRFAASFAMSSIISSQAEFHVERTRPPRVPRC